MLANKRNMLIGAAMFVALACAGVAEAQKLGLHTGYDLSEYNAFGSWLHKPVQTAAFFVGGGWGGWAQIEGTSWLLGRSKAFLQGGSGRQVSLQLAMMPSGMGVTLAQIAAGTHDAHYRRLANNLAANGLLGIELRLGHEMDGKWFPWGAPSGSGKEASYAAAFRRIVTVMRQAQPTNKWKWVWNPTCDNWPLSAGATYLQKLWPGEAYVDQVGVNTYDKSFGTGKVYYPSGSNRLQRQQDVWVTLVRRLNILRDFAKAHGKPLQFPEWGLMQYNSAGNYAGYGGGDNPYFIQKMHEFITYPANNVAMHSYFDVLNSLGDHRIAPPGSVFLKAQAKYKQLFGDAP
jgi:hypothetical protein